LKAVEQKPKNSLYPLKRRRLSEEISEQLKGSIFGGEFKPGDKLPYKGELCEIFGVARPVVREALRFLENSGLIQVKPGAGGGAFVKKIGSRTLSNAFEGIIKLEKVTGR
jgi:GntR family transcriptional regulator, transcriptional repressor for pyruvate dehydrogenase complex